MTARSTLADKHTPLRTADTQPSPAERSGPCRRSLPSPTPSRCPDTRSRLHRTSTRSCRLPRIVQADTHSRRGSAPSTLKHTHTRRCSCRSSRRRCERSGLADTARRAARQQWSPAGSHSQQHTVSTPRRSDYCSCPRCIASPSEASLRGRGTRTPRGSLHTAPRRRWRTVRLCTRLLLARPLTSRQWGTRSLRCSCCTAAMKRRCTGQPGTVLQHRGTKPDGSGCRHEQRRGHGHE